MKIRCSCGHTIVDNSDFKRNKAHVVSDQDYEDASELPRYSAEVGELERQMRRCAGCGRLALDTPDGLAWFLPENEPARGEVLRSAHGDEWRGHLRGHWGAGEGTVWWNTNVEEGYETFDTEQAVHARYHETFERLSQRDLLRSSFLRVHGEMTHLWEPVG